MNIRSIQSKFDDLEILNWELKLHIIFLTETKVVSSSYPSVQFQLEGCHSYRKNRTKGGCGLMAYFCLQVAITDWILQLLDTVQVEDIGLKIRT